MIIAKSVVFTVIQSSRFTNHNLLPKERIIIEKSKFPILPIGATYELAVNPYTFDEGQTISDTARVKVQAMEYRETDGSYELICTAHVFSYNGLRLQFGEVEV